MKIQNQVTPNPKKNPPVTSPILTNLNQILNQTLAPETLPIETPDVPEEMPTLTPPTPQPDSDSTPVVSDPINVDDGAKENDIEEIGKFEMTNNPLDPENKKGYYMDMEISDPDNPEVEESGKVADENVVTLDTEGDLEKEQVDLYYQETDGEKGTEVEAGIVLFDFFLGRTCIFVLGREIFFSESNFKKWNPLD